MVAPVRGWTSKSGSRRLGVDGLRSEERGSPQAGASTSRSAWRVTLSNRPATKLNSARKCPMVASVAIAISSTVLAGLMGAHQANAQTQNTSAPPTPDEIAQRLAEQQRPRTVVPFDPKGFDQY